MNMNLKIALSVALALLLGIVFGREISLKSNGRSSGSTSVRSYELSVAYSGWPGWKVAYDTLARITNAAPQIRTSYGGVQTGDVSTHIEQLDTIATRGINGVVLCGSDSRALTPVVNKLSEHGIPVVTLFTDAEGSKRITFVTADDRASARRLIERVLKEIPAPPDGAAPLKVVASYPKPGMTWGEERLLGVKDALLEFPYAELVDVISDEGDDAKGAEAIAAAWRRFGKLDLIVGLGGRSGMCGVAAIRELHLPKGTVRVTGWDMDPDLLKALKDGWVTAVSAPKMEFMTELAVSILESHRLSQKRYPNRIDIEQSYIDRKNVQEFLGEAN